MLPFSNIEKIDTKLCSFCTQKMKPYYLFCYYQEKDTVDPFLLPAYI